MIIYGECKEGVSLGPPLTRGPRSSVMGQIIRVPARQLKGVNVLAELRSIRTTVNRLIEHLERAAAYERRGRAVRSMAHQGSSCASGCARSTASAGRSMTKQDATVVELKYIGGVRSVTTTQTRRKITNEHK